MKRNFRCTWVAAGATLLFLTGCMSVGAQRYTPTFDYSPPEGAKPAAANVTFAVVDTNYPQLIPAFQLFGRNMSQDFFEILTARGYTVRGPFRTYDEITYTDKKGSDLVLIPDLQISGDASNLRWSPSFGAALLGQSGYTGEGQLVINGRVTLVVAESLSHEKMWTKSVDLPPLTVQVDETRMYKQPGIPVEMLLQSENGLYNDIAKALETEYKGILERAYAYLDPDEMQIVKRQAQEIRAKKVY